MQTNSILLRLPEDLQRRIQDYADILGKTPGEMVVYMIRYALATDDGLFDEDLV